MWKNYVWNPITCSCENGKYLTSIIVGSEIICNEVTDAEAKSNDKAKSNDQKTNTVSANFKEKKANHETQNFYMLLAFSLITMTLLIAVSIWCYLIKFWAKQKYLLSFQFTIKKLKEIIY